MHNVYIFLFLGIVLLSNCESSTQQTSVNSFKSTPMDSLCFLQNYKERICLDTILQTINFKCGINTDSFTVLPTKYSSLMGKNDTTILFNKTYIQINLTKDSILINSDVVNAAFKEFSTNLKEYGIICDPALYLSNDSTKAIILNFNYSIPYSDIGTLCEMKIYPDSTSYTWQRRKD